MKSLMVLRTYAQALRGDWGSIDGRSEKIALNAVADAIEAEHAGERVDVARLADAAGVCLSCCAWLNGSLCEHDTNQTTASQQQERKP